MPDETIYNTNEEKCTVCKQPMNDETGLFDMNLMEGGHIACMLELWKKNDGNNNHENNL